MPDFSAFMEDAKKALGASKERISAFSNASSKPKKTGMTEADLKKKHPDKFKKYLLDPKSDNISFKDYLSA